MVPDGVGPCPRSVRAVFNLMPWGPSSPSGLLTCGHFSSLKELVSASHRVAQRKGMALGIRGPGLGAIAVSLLLVFSNRLGAQSG